MAMTFLFIIEFLVLIKEVLGIGIHSFTKKLCIEHLLCTKHNPSVWEYSSGIEQMKILSGEAQYYVQ